MPDLNLLALDEEGLKVISAHAQDAIIRVADMGFAKSDNRFALIMNRFAWEEEKPHSKGIRRRSAMHFDHVKGVKSTGIDINAREGILNLLMIGFEEESAPEGIVTLSFAGGGTVELKVECLELRLSDLGASWAAKSTPSHKISD
ncbi:MAG: DUF2948 family protein [Devosiaceae bacterium]|nr:DUF2948 family protein [Devosiaceae bacterium]